MLTRVVAVVVEVVVRASSLEVCSYSQVKVPMEEEVAAAVVVRMEMIVPLLQADESPS